MGSPALVMNDRITGSCAIHQVPNPSSGAPQPSPGPLPFSAPLTNGLVASVEINRKAAAVVGSSGYNTPPHIGLHLSDPFVQPAAQEGKVLTGSATVTIGDKAAATIESKVQCCATPGSVAPTVKDVLIG
jgi:uncharacterized Zn-binding protein involved in type VI secretion